MFDYGEVSTPEKLASLDVTEVKNLRDAFCTAYEQFLFFSQKPMYYQITHPFKALQLWTDASEKAKTFLLRYGKAVEALHAVWMSNKYTTPYPPKLISPIIHKATMEELYYTLIDDACDKLRIVADEFIKQSSN